MQQELSDTLKGLKGKLVPMRCDVTKEDEILSVFESIKKDIGGVDVCINNAGMAVDAPLLTGKTEDWRRMFEVRVEHVGGHLCWGLSSAYGRCVVSKRYTAS